MKLDHLKCIKTLDPSSHPQQQYTLSELQEALKLYEDIIVEKSQGKLYLYVFISSLAAILFAPVVFSIFSPSTITIYVAWLLTASLVTSCSVGAHELSKRLEKDCTKKVKESINR